MILTDILANCRNTAAELLSLLDRLVCGERSKWKYPHTAKEVVCAI